MPYKLKKHILTEKNISYALNALLSWLFALALMHGILSLTILSATVPEMAQMLLRVILICAVVLYNKYTLAGFIVLAAGFAFYAYRSLTGDYPAEFLLEHIYTFNQTWFFMTGEISFTQALNDSTLRLLALAFGVVSSLLLRLRFSYPFIFVLGAGIFLSVNLAHPNGNHAAFAPLLVVLILIYIKRAKNSTKKVVALAPVCVLIVVLATALPMPNIDEGRRILGEAYEEAFWIIRSPFMPRYFSTHWLGFEQRDGTLGGNLTQSGDFIMWVFADEPVYLTAITKNIFTGRSWESRHQEYYFAPRYYPDFSAMRNLVLMEYVENHRYRLLWDWGEHRLTAPTDMNRIINIHHDEFWYTTQPRRVSINIGRVRTGTVFTPPGSLALSIHGDGYTLLQRGADLRVTPTFGRNMSYTLLFHTVDIEDESMQYILRRSHRGFYEMRLEEISERINLLNYASPMPPLLYSGVITKYVYENIRIPYANYVFENYMNLPDTLPERVKDLAHAIAAPYESDFDRAVAIKEYLLELTYTLSPGDLPYGRDFVDHFLFDIRRGYCTHFASAMAIMSRAIGIPSRYNMGFMTPGEPEDGLFRVYGLHAHAWAELYFEGVGWIIFEATPPYDPEVYYYADIPLSGFGFGSYWDDYWLLYEYYEMYFLMQMMAEQLEGGIWVAPTPGGTVAAEQTEINTPALIAIGIALAAGTYLFIKKAEETRRHKIINGDQYNQSVREGFKGTVELLGLYGLPMQPHESAIGYSKRIERLSPLGIMQLRTAAEIFSRARYSQIEINKDDAEFIRKNYYKMYEKMKESGSRTRFFVHRYVKRL